MFEQSRIFDFQVKKNDVKLTPSYCGCVRPRVFSNRSVNLNRKPVALFFDAATGNDVDIETVIGFKRKRATLRSSLESNANLKVVILSV